MIEEFRFKRRWITDPKMPTEALLVMALLQPNINQKEKRIIISPELIAYNIIDFDENKIPESLLDWIEIGLHQLQAKKFLKFKYSPSISSGIYKIIFTDFMEDYLNENKSMAITLDVEIVKKILLTHIGKMSNLDMLRVYLAVLANMIRYSNLDSSLKNKFFVFPPSKIARLICCSAKTRNKETEKLLKQLVRLNLLNEYESVSESYRRWKGGLLKNVYYLPENEYLLLPFLKCTEELKTQYKKRNTFNPEHQMLYIDENDQEIYGYDELFEQLDLEMEKEDDDYNSSDRFEVDFRY